MTIEHLLLILFCLLYFVYVGAHVWSFVKQELAVQRLSNRRWEHQIVFEEHEEENK